MTILNVMLVDNGRRAFIATDTEAVTSDGRSLRATKVWPLPHLRAVIAGRGDLQFLALCAMNLCLMQPPISELEDDFFPRMFDQYEAAGGKEIAQSAVIVAWVEEAQSMQIIQISQGAPAGVDGLDPTKRGWSHLNCGRGYFSPWNADMGPMPNPTTERELIALSKFQFDFCRRTLGGMIDGRPSAAGGSLLIACHLPDSTSIVRTLEFEDLPRSMPSAPEAVQL